jgi:hypothetical protein
MTGGPAEAVLLRNQGCCARRNEARASQLSNSFLRRVLFSRDVASYRAIFRRTFPRFFRVTVLFASSGCF